MAVGIGIDEHRPVPGGHWFGYGGYRPPYVRNDVRVTNVTNVRNVTINQYNVTERNRARNRRVQFIILDQDKAPAAGKKPFTPSTGNALHPSPF